MDKIKVLAKTNLSVKRLLDKYKADDDAVEAEASRLMMNIELNKNKQKSALLVNLFDKVHEVVNSGSDACNDESLTLANDNLECNEKTNENLEYEDEDN